MLSTGTLGAPIFPPVSWFAAMARSPTLPTVLIAMFFRSKAAGRVKLKLNR